MSKKDDKKVVSLAGARGREKEKEKTKEKTADSTEKEQVVYCSFCGRPNYMVIKMIKGPGVSICSECVMICVQYLVLEDRVPASEVQKVLDSFWQGVKK